MRITCHGLCRLCQVLALGRRLLPGFLLGIRVSKTGRLDEAFGRQPTLSACQKCQFSSLFRELVRKIHFWSSKWRCHIYWPFSEGGPFLSTQSSFLASIGPHN